MWVNCKSTVHSSVSPAFLACQEVTVRYSISETLVQAENAPVVAAVCIFLRTAGTLNGSLSTNLQPPLNPSHTSSCSLSLRWLHPSPPAIQQLAQRQEARRDGGEREGKPGEVSGGLVEEFTDRKRIGCTYRECRGAAGRNRVVSEGLQLESVQEPLSWNSRR